MAIKGGGYLGVVSSLKLPPSPAGRDSNSRRLRGAHEEPCSLVLPPSARNLVCDLGRWDRTGARERKEERRREETEGGKNPVSSAAPEVAVSFSL